MASSTLLAGALLLAATTSPSFAAAAAAAEAPPAVNLDYATLQGRANANDHSWEYLGIPFAKAGRFEHPALYNASDALGTVNATSYGPICPQKTTGSILTLNSSYSLLLGQEGTAIGTVVGSLVDTLYNSLGVDRQEDCLSINVQTPQNITVDAKLPVLIWIHGGGFEVGSPVTATSETDLLRAQAINYNPGGLLKTAIEMDQPIITVSATYRLSAFGFSASREMADAGLLNLGLEDQRAAMQWVQNYIHLFGGDPDQVTIFGESAGSWSVNAHLLWDDGDNQGLFHGAIAASGGPVMVDGPERQQAVFDNMLVATNCSDAADKIACLKEAAFEDILASINQEGMLLGPRSLASTWTIRPDGNHLKDSPHRLVKTGNIAQVPLMIGDMRDEGTLFSLLAQFLATTDDDFESYFRQVWWPNATHEDMQGLMDLYVQDPQQGSPYTTDPSTSLASLATSLVQPTPNYKRLASLVGDYSFEAQRRNLLRHWNTSTPVWNYIHDQDLPLVAELLPAESSVLADIPLLGSFHASDVWLNVFGQVPASLSKNTRDRQATMVSFVRNLEPNAHGLAIPDWPEWTAEKQETYRFKESGPEVVADDYRAERMEYINDHPDAFLI